MSITSEIFEGDANKVLKSFADKSVNCCITSPPYFGLRDYGHKGQIGLEETPKQYVQKLVKVFREVKRVLRDDGTLWLNLGDSYAGSGKGIGDDFTGRWKQGTHEGSRSTTTRTRNVGGNIKSKDLIGIPWQVAFALRDDGWYLRQDIIEEVEFFCPCGCGYVMEERVWRWSQDRDMIWKKPNPMPESVTDRCTKSHEYIFLLSKSPKYYYDYEAIKTPIQDATVQRMMQQNLDAQKGSERVPGKPNGAMKAVGPGRKPAPHDSRGGNQGSTTGIKAYSHRGTGDKTITGHSGNFDVNGNLMGDGMANKKSVWTVSTKPFKEAHFATFPEDLIVDCVKAGCPEEGVVLDPFGGAFTTAVVSRKLNRHYKIIELNPDYIKIGKNRLHQELGMFQ